MACDCPRSSSSTVESFLRSNVSSLPMLPTGTRNRTGDELYVGFLAGYVHSKVVLGALLLAIETINNDSTLLPGKKLRLRAVDIGAQKSLKAFPIQKMTEMRDNGIVVFIGPDETCTSEALVASAWNLPMISYKCADIAVSDKTVYSSFARTLPPATKVSKSVAALLLANNWHCFSIVASKHPAWSMEIAHAIEVKSNSTFTGVGVVDKVLQAGLNNLSVNHFRFYSDYIPSKIYELQEIVDNTYHNTRVYVFVGDHIEMVDFVRCLQNRKLLSTGDYIVISIDDEIYDPNMKRNIYQGSSVKQIFTPLYQPNHKSMCAFIAPTEYSDFYQKYIGNSKDKHQQNRKRYNYKDQERLQEAFQSVLRISPLFPMNPKYRKLCHQIKLYSRKDPFRVPLPYNRNIFDAIQVPIYGAYLYDALIIYARAATEILRDGGDISDGRLIMRHIFNRSYHSIQGFDVYIDVNGDAEGNFSVIALQKDDKVNNSLHMSMQPVAMFVYGARNATTGTTLPEFRYLNPNRPIMWLKGRPPLAEPICGFYNEKCRPKAKDWRYITGALVVILFMAIFTIILFKHYRYEQTLACLLWKVDMKDVILITSPDALYNNELRKNLYLHKRSVDITRNIRKELKQMREIRHENLITFVGASIDHGTVSILTSYCARGSLVDVLSNEDLKLDHMFVSSLVSDIVKGLIYLHDSDVGSHGNLRSSKILIDSRWVAQIADFGLHEFKSCQEEPSKFEKELRRSLWKAPEILRDPNCPSKGTQKGDVYSFGIVLYEIIGRKGPWGDVNMSWQDIVARVMSPEEYGIFRPSLRGIDAPEYVIQLLHSCWEEDPEDRPDIRLVRVKLKPMQAGLKPNIFDNMLAIMEKYAYNLEGIVQERTNQLSEEKKKTESLLLRMLPKSVAESLKRGERVEAECFDCVTIFFSDLVGFTELCAQSTPFEVVEMLNDLYTCCDFIISSYDVYKVETIGDAYMVVSGLPLRNGDRHAGEFIQMRIGIHSGQCVAGVVGLKMPRYCLFGDTVNTASRMESNGEALKIHISSVTHGLLKKLGGYKCEERGIIKVKGKGEMRTYWLLGEDDQKRMDRFGSNDAITSLTIPDLLCTPDQSQTNLSRPSLRRMLSDTVPMLHASHQHSTSDQQIPSVSFLAHNGPNLGCYICHKRKLHMGNTPMADSTQRLSIIHGRRSLRFVSSKSDHLKMIHDILCTLFSSNAELPIENFTIPEVASTFLHPGEIHILEELIRIANQYKEIKKFIQQYGTLTAGLLKPKQQKPSEEPLPQGLYLQAFVDGLELVVKPYRDLVVELEAKYLKRPNLSLMFIFHQVSQYRSLFGFLLQLISGVVTQRIHGCALLPYLQQHCLHGNDANYQAVKTIQKSVYVIFLKQLYGWLMHGKFVDHYGEFFIQQVESTPKASTATGVGVTSQQPTHTSVNTSDSASINTELWRYEIRREMLPYYFPSSWAEKVLFVGQTVLMCHFDPRQQMVDRAASRSDSKGRKGAALAAATGKDNLWGEHEQELFRKFHQLQNEENLNVTKFEHLVDEIKEQVTKHMSMIVIEKADLERQLRLMKDFFLLGRGELFSEFLSQTNSLKLLIGREINDGTTRDLNRALQLAANSINLGEDIEQFSFELPGKDEIEESSFCYETKSAVGHIMLKYKVKWPLHLLFSPRILDRYNEMFRFLLRIKKIQHDLLQIWSYQRERRMKHNSEVVQLRNKLLFLINNLQYYLQVDVLESQFAILMAAIANSARQADFERIQRAHTIFQANVLSLCFLLTGSNSGDLSSLSATATTTTTMAGVIKVQENPVLTILDSILSIVDRFCTFCLMCKDPMTKMERQEFLTYEQGFMNHVDSLLKLLIGLKAGPSSAPLSQLLLRLDFNHWFSSNTQTPP
uniref:Guanylate cyclase n=1 Tax=Anopheles epiroticus TaxID=199890 RepID=A0A182P9Q0_9DIPT